MNWLVLSLCALGFTGLGNLLVKLSTQTRGSGDDASPLATLCLVCLGYFIIGLCVFWLKKPGFSSNPISTGLGLLGGLSFGLGGLSLVMAFSRPGALTGVVTGIMNTNFAMVAILSTVFLKEVLSWKQIAGVVTVLAGMLLLI